MSDSHTQTIGVRLPDSGKPTREDIQLMPCTINHDGEMQNMEEYFIIEKSEARIQHSAFRGRPIKSKETEIPSGYTGLVLQESRSSNKADEERQFLVQHQFTKFTHWELDNPPNADNTTQKSLDWLKLSEVLHETITD